MCVCMICERKKERYRVGGCVCMICERKAERECQSEWLFMYDM